MANWSNPLITTQYDVFLAEMKERDVDSATMFFYAATNIPGAAVRFNRATKVFEEWNGQAWNALVIGITGGGTGSGTSSGAAANLGLGTMAFQNSHNVTITSGTASLIWLRAATGIYPTTDLSCDLGDASTRFNRGYICGGLVVPVGVDKYVVG